MEKRNNEAEWSDSACGRKVERLSFYGGWISSAVPMVFFVAWAISFCLYCREKGAPDEGGLILGVLIGITLGMFFVKGPWSDYCQAVFDGMSQPVGVIAIVCWMWAGIFAKVLSAGKLVEGLVWLGIESGCHGGTFTAVTFLLAALFATAVGTGYGTTLAFCTLMYPAGLILGADPVVLFGAILSGAAFGDNLAPVSDTTIVSAVTQETDIPGVVRSRFGYAIAAAIPALALFWLTGAGSGVEVPGEALQDFASRAKPDGLVLLLPFALVIYLALRGFHIITSITWGILVATVLILGFQLAPASHLLAVDLHMQDGGAAEITGAFIGGINGFVKLSVLILFIVAAGYLMQVGGALENFKRLILRLVGTKVWAGETAMFFSVFLMNFFITVNTAAEIAAAPFVRDIGKNFRLHPYRRANMLDAVSSALGYIFPWSGGVLVGAYAIGDLAREYSWLPQVGPTEVFPYVFHGWLLAAVMLGAALTGWGRRYEGPNGEPVKKLEN